MKIKRKVGRPSIAAKHRLGKTLGARFRPSQELEIMRAIEASGQSQGEWIRNALLTTAGQAPELISNGRGKLRGSDHAKDEAIRIAHSCAECSSEKFPNTAKPIGQDVQVGMDSPTDFSFYQCSKCGSVWVQIRDSGRAGHGTFRRRLTERLF
jgi:hypothetical protein